ncbi:MAG: S8 family serine peptidase [Crocinitomicaceae bacterium]|nr:S8 family serine peptidase [Crocinitomicaceae bacterium]
MKTRSLSTLVLLTLFIAQNALSQVTYANREWVEHSPLTSSNYKHTSSIVHNKNLYVTGHTLNSNGDTDIITIKYNSDGDTVWSKTYEGSSGEDDYGIDLIMNNSNELIVIGTTRNTGSDNDYTVLKYAISDGSLEWDYSWDGPQGGIDIPSDVTLDGNDEIYICGGTKDAFGFSDYGVIKLENGGGTLDWDMQYDGDSLYDAATNILFDAEAGLVVTGGTNDSIGVWSITTLTLDKTDGSILGEVEATSTDVTLVEATAMIIDDENNIYITGFEEVAGKKNVQTIKLDSTFTIDWITGYDGGNDDVGNDIGVDANGNVYVTGYSDQGNGKTKAVTIKYAITDGDTLWTELFGNVISQDGVNAKKMSVEGNGDIYITGTTYGNGPNSFAFFKYNSDGQIKLYREYLTDSLDNDGFDIQVDGESVYLTGFTETISGTRMTSLKYSLTERDSSLEYNSTSGLAWRKDRELIVRVDTSLVNQKMVDQLEYEFWSLDDIFDSTLVSNIEESLKEICSDNSCPIKVFRIYRNLTTYDTVSISRLGDTVHVPTVWATFLFEFPNGVNITDASDTIVQLFPDIKYSTYNLVGYLDNTEPDDPEWDQQASLQHDPYNQWADAHINVEPAWEYTAGRRDIRIGILDEAVQWDHVDFGDSANTKMNGWDYYQGMSMYNAPGPQSVAENHGTKVAGIVGAIRNNDYAIAGITGGSYTNGANIDSSGCALYGINVTVNFSSLIMDYVADAIFNSSIDSDTSVNTYGLHIMNCSWGLSNHPVLGPTNPWWLDTNIVMLREAVHFANRNKVTMVATRGNKGHLQDSGFVHHNYPGTLDEDWIICVGGLGTDGNYHNMDHALEYDYKTSRGWEIDVSAASNGAHNWTTAPFDAVNVFSGTSAAAPHITGTAGLMMSYYNDTIAAHKNLAPEDIEYILEMTAIDRDTANFPGVDSLTGYGLIDAGAALKQIDTLKYTLYHFGTDVNSFSISSSVYSNNDTITLTERYENQSGNWYLPNIPYVIKTHQIQIVTTHGIGTNDTILAYWPRPSSSNLLELFDNGTKTLRPRERLYIASLSNMSATLNGYIYEVSDTSGNSLGWWPFNLDYAKELTYSVLTSDTTVFLNEPEIKSTDRSVTIFPNPSSSFQQLVIHMDQPMATEIRLIDISGKTVKLIYNGHLMDGRNDFYINLSNLHSGIYIYSILFEDGTTVYQRIIKE